MASDIKNAQERCKKKETKHKPPHTFDELRNRGYSAWTDPYGSNEENPNHLHTLIKKQKAASGIVTAIGIATLEQEIIATGYFNVARNASWEWHLKKLPSMIGEIITFPKLNLAGIMYYNSALLKHYDITKELTRGTQNWLNSKAKTLEADAKIKRTAINRFSKNEIGKKILEAPTNAIHAGLGVLVHAPQGLYGVQQFIETEGTLNGHLGAIPAMLGYGLLAYFHVDRVPKLKESYNKHINDKDFLWTNKIKHTEMGFFETGQYAKYITLVAAPPILFNIKGLSYMAEGVHELPWKAEELVKFPEKISQIDYNSIYEYLLSMDLNSAFNAAANADYSNTVSTAISLAWVAAGGMFIKSAWGEMKADVIPSAQYAWNKYIFDPIDIKSQQIKHDLDEIISKNDIDITNVKKQAIRKLQPNKEQYILIHPDDYISNNIKKREERFPIITDDGSIEENEIEEEETSPSP